MDARNHGAERDARGPCCFGKGQLLHCLQVKGAAYMAGSLRRAASPSASSVLRIAAGSTGLRPLPQRSTPRSTAGAEQQEGHAQAQAVDGHQDQALGGGAASTTRAGLT